MDLLKQIVFLIKKMNSFKNFKIITSLFFIFLIFFFSFDLKANEVKILAKVNNNIITNIDVKKEYNYLITLNTSLKEIDKQQVLQYAKDSLIKEKIKEIEILKIYELNKKNKTVDLMIENILENLGFNSKIEFENYLENNNLTLNEVYKKIEIEAVWNQMIYTKFKDKLFIDEDELKKKISKDRNKIENLLLSEIIVPLKNKNEINLKYDEIVKSINSIGFKETVIKFSISNSKNNSGLLGWVDKNTLPNKIQNQLQDLDIGEITKPILISSGIMILKLEDKKLIEKNTNNEIELEKLINFEMNNQLNNFSSIFFNKIKKNIIVNEY